MTNWNHDISAAPRGKTEKASRTVATKDRFEIREYDKFIQQDVILASKCGKVIKSYWIPDENRFAGFKAGEEIVGWMAWPEHPFAETQRQQGTDGGEIAAVKVIDRLANAAGVEPSPSDHFILEDVGGGA